MRPFSIGHRLILTQIDSAFVAGRVPLYEDLIASVFVCAWSWEENQRLAASPRRRWLHFKLWGLLAGRFDIPGAMLAFLNYIRTGDVFPETNSPDSDSTTRELGSDQLARLYLFLRSSGFDDSSTWNMPINAANAMHAAKLEEDGKLSLIGPSRRALLDLVRKQQGVAA